MPGDAGAAPCFPSASLEPDPVDLCPLCGRRDGTVLSTRDRSGGRLVNLLCGGCGLIGVRPRPTRREYEDFYRSQYRLAYKRRRLPSRRQQVRAARAARERLPWFLEAAPAGAGVLEIGCGHGYFLRLVRQLGHAAAGVEPDPACAEFARRVFGLEVEAAFAETVSLAGRTFGCICAFHVLEHVLDPVRFLRSLHQFAAPGARLLLETPNAEAPFPRPSRRFHRAHLYSFSARTLSLVLEAAGWLPIRLGLSRDGGNLFAIAAAARASAPQIRPGEAEEALARWRRSASARSYYLSPVVWLRALRRLRDHAIEFALAPLGSLARHRNFLCAAPPLLAALLEGLVS